MEGKEAKLFSLLIETQVYSLSRNLILKHFKYRRVNKFLSTESLKNAKKGVQDATNKSHLSTSESDAPPRKRSRVAKKVFAPSVVHEKRHCNTLNDDMDSDDSMTADSSLLGLLISQQGRSSTPITDFTHFSESRHETDAEVVVTTNKAVTPSTEKYPSELSMAENNDTSSVVPLNTLALTAVYNTERTAAPVDNAERAAAPVDNTVRATAPVDNAVRTAATGDNAVRTAATSDNAVRSASPGTSDAAKKTVSPRKKGPGFSPKKNLFSINHSSNGYDRCLRELAGINKSLSQLLIKVDKVAISFCPEIELASTNKSEIPVLPLSDEVAEKWFEELIQDSRNSHVIVKHLSGYGSSMGRRHTVNGIISKMLSNKLASTYNFKGKNKPGITAPKRPFQQSQIYPIVIAAVKKYAGKLALTGSGFEVANKDVGQDIIAWLKDAPKRPKTEEHGASADPGQ